MGASSDPRRAAWARDLHLLARAGIGSSLAMSVLTHVCLSAETCPQPVVPPNGRMLGRSMRVGHDVHFVCDAGFRLVGSETRACRQDRTWSGTQPSCRSEVERGQGVTGSALPGGSSIAPSCGGPIAPLPRLQGEQPRGCSDGQQDGALTGFCSWCSSAPSPSRYRRLLQQPVCQRWDLRGRQPELHVPLRPGLVRPQLP